MARRAEVALAPRFKLTLPRVILGVTVAATISYWFVLARGVLIFQALPGWFWRFIDKPLPLAWLILPMGVGAALGIGSVLRHTDRTRRNLALLILLGVALQHGFALMEGRGMSGLKDRLLLTGHAEFIRIAASSNLDMATVARRYEKWSAQAGVVYPRSKPPGQMLFYMLLERLSNLLLPSFVAGNRLTRLILLALMVFPVLTYVAIVPLFYFSKIFVEEKQAYVAAILFLFVPNVALVTMHLDGALYPTVTMCCMLLGAKAMQERSGVLAFLAGVSTFAALYISFSLLPIALFVMAGMAFGCWLPDQRSGGLVGMFRLLGAYAAAIFLAGIVCWMVLNYDPIARYKDAMAFHASWKQRIISDPNPIYLGFLDWVEFACWIGIPLAVACVADFGHAIRRLLERKSAVSDFVPLTLSVTLLVLGLFTRTVGEVARLWLFLVPLVCVSGARALSRWFPSTHERALATVILLEGVTAFMIKRFQDFA